MSTKEKIKLHKEHMQENLELAKKAAKARRYFEAATWYSGVAFHEQIIDALGTK